MKNNIITQQLKDIYEKYWENLNDLQRRKIAGYLYITLTLFTVSFFGFFAIAPTLNTISMLQKQYEDNQLVYEALNKKLSNLQLLDFEYKEIQPDLPAIYAAIPRSPQIPYLTRQVENIALSSAVTITRLNFNSLEVYPNPKKDSIYSFTFTVAVEGEQANVNNFLENLINFDRIVGIDRVSTGKSDNGQTAASITGRAFFSTQ